MIRINEQNGSWCWTMDEETMRVLVGCIRREVGSGGFEGLSEDGEIAGRLLQAIGREW